MTDSYDLEQRLEKAEWVLNNAGFRRCDIPACNCGSWHQVGGFKARFDEIKEAVEEADYSTNGKTLLDVVKEIIADAKRTGDVAQSVGMRAALESAQKIIERDFPNGQLAIDIRAVLASQPSPAATVETRLTCANCESSLDAHDAPMICATCREMGAAPSLIQRTTELLGEADQLIKREGASDDARAVANVLANGIEDLLKAMRGKRYAMPPPHDGSSAGTSDVVNRLIARGYLREDAEDIAKESGDAGCGAAVITPWAVDEPYADSGSLTCANCKSKLDEKDSPLVCGMCREMGAAPSLIQRATELLDEADQLIRREGASDDARAVANVLANGIEDLLKAMRGKRYAMPTEPQEVPEQLRSSGRAEQNGGSSTWTAGIDALRQYPYQDEQWHLHAIEFHHKVREEAEGLRDRWLALSLPRPVLLRDQEAGK